MKVLSVDPSSTELGFAILESTETDNLVAWGVCRAGVKRYEERLPFIVQTLDQVLEDFKPDCVVCEEAIRFKGRSIPALQGVVTCIKHWTKRQKLSLTFYNPSTWKSGVTGNGRATKDQVARTVRLFFGDQLEDNAAEHITDAIAIGLHFLSRKRWESMEVREGNMKQ